MKKITLFLIMLGFFLTASAQYDFPPIVGPITIVSGENIAINVNDLTNTAGVTASSSGSYNSFLVTVDWVAGDGNPWSNEAQLTLTTTAGDVLIDPPTSGSGFNGDDTTLTFEGDFSGIYNPLSDGYLDLFFDQSYADSEANYSNIVVTLYESPTCVVPTGMMTSMLTTTEVDLAWTAGFSETAWNVEYNSGADFTPGNGEEEGSANVTGTAATSFTGLTEDTNYYVYYQADCGSEDGVSEWVGPFTFYTGICESVPTSLDGQGLSQIQLGSEIFTSAGDDVTYEDFTGTTVDLAAAVTANLQITFATGWTYGTNVWIDINNDLVYDNETELFYQGVSLAANPTTLNASFTMPDAPLGIYNMRIGTADSGQATPNPCYSGSYGVTADMTINITAAPNCVPPSALTVNGIGASTADLSWDQVGTVSQWNIEVVTAGTPPTGTPTDSDISNPYTASGLDGLTSYDYYVQANCGSELSAWSGPFTFMTLCDVTIPDYFQDFTDVTFAVAPECWDEANNGNPTTGPTELGAGSWTSDGFLNAGATGAYKVNIYGTFLNDWILSPQFDLTGGPFQVEFDFGITQWGNANAGTLGSDDLVQLLISNDNGATWTTLVTYDTTSVVPASGAHPVVNLTAYSGQIVQFGIYATDGTVDDTVDVDVFVDNFQVRAVPECPEPNDLAVTNITSNGAELSWVEAGTSAIWNVEIVEAGETPTGIPTDTNVSNPYIATGLDAITSYDFYVQSDCGGDMSVYTGPLNFTTLCSVFIPDYIQNFTTITPDCWDEANNGDLTSGPTDLGASSWTADGFLNDGFTGAYKINLYGTSFNDWILSPQFDLTGGPFQVEFDFGITTWGNANVGTLGSDDVVEFLISTDNGATWSSLITYDNTSTVSENGEHPVMDLTAYSGQIVQFAFYATSGTVNDSQDNDVFVDNFRVRGIPTCPEPTDLTAVNLSLTSTELGWTESGIAASWNIQYGEAGFALGTGTIEPGVTTNPYILSGLTADTSYEYYVQAICSPGDESSFNGPFEFFTGYCASIPSSNDGNGVNNATIGLTDFPSPGDVTYENNTSPVVNVFQGINTNVEIEFAHTATYNTNIWIDFNDDLVFDTTEMVYAGASAGGSNPHILDASFTMPLTAPIGEHRMRIVSTDFVQTPVTPCYNGSWGVTLDFTVNVQELLCTLAEAEFTTVPDCDNDQFYIAVNIIDLGDATSLEISNNFDGGTIQVFDTETYQAGPFDFGTAVKVFVTNEQDNNCVISSDTFEILACPPSNDECENAITAVVNEFGSCDLVTPGTILAASPSNVPDSSCTGTPNDDVWFEFTALSEVQLISIINIIGGTTNIDHAVYEGSCGALTELYCSDDDASITPQLTIGTSYYIRVFSGGSQLETSTFDLCIRPAPTNTLCENAENFCSQGGALVAPSIFGIPSAGAIACLTSAQNPTWNTIQIGSPGLVEIQISQVDDDGFGLDVDYALWGPFNSVEESCDNLDLGCPTPGDCPGIPYAPEFYPYGNIADCSWSADSIETLTIDNALSGEIYILLVSNYGNQPGTITIEQTNAGGPTDGTIEAEISAEIVSDEVLFDATDDPNIVEANVCGFESIIIETSSPFADEYVWYKDGFVMEGETSSTLMVTESDNYQVQATDTQCGSEAFSQIVYINLYADPAPLAPQTLTACDGPEVDGTETFDLDAFSTSLGLEGFTVSYYLTTDDAAQAINPVASQYDSTGETLIIRIEDENAAEDPDYLGCRELSQVELIVNPRPVINQPSDFVVCDDLDGVVDGETEFDLVSINSEVTTEDDRIISYHTSLDAAEAGTGALTSPYSSSGETVFVRAENTVTGCYQTTSFALEVNIVPLADFDLQYNYIVCPAATVPITIGITPSNFTDADVSVSWSLDGNPISGNGTTLNTVLLAGEYSATITFNGTGCSNTISTTVEEAESCIFPEGISPGVSPGQNDTFDLSSFDVTKLEIFNRYGTLVYSKNNYTDEWVGQTNDGDELPVGTYFYTVNYEGGTKTKSAWVYINR